MSDKKRKDPIVKAILLTRCGCSKILVIPYPPGPEVRVALRRKEQNPGEHPAQNLSENTPVEVRVFTRQFVGYPNESDQTQELHAFYREV